MEYAALASLLRKSRREKLTQLELISPADARAIELIIDDCLVRRWPRTPAEWFALKQHA